MGVNGSALSQHLLGILYAHKGRYDEAEEMFLRAVKADPEMAGSYVELGLVYACRSEYTKMVEALRRAVGPGGVRAYLGERPLGDVTVTRAPNTPGRASAAAEGESVVVHSLLASAMSCLSEGREMEAAAMLKQALEDEPDSPPAVTALLALADLLRGESVKVNDAGVRRG